MSQTNCLKRLKNRIFSYVLSISLLTLLFTFLLSDVTYAQTSNQISLQGKIVRNDAGYEGLNVVNGTPTCVASGADTCDFQIKYYDDASGTTLYYTETFVDVEIGDYGGVFNLSLGDPTSSSEAYNCGPLGSSSCGASLPEVLRNYNDIYIEIGFAPAGASSFTETFTKTPLNASPYAISASQAAGDSFGLYNTDDTGESSLTATEGAVYYNTDDDTLKVYTASGWVSLATGGSTLWTESSVGSDYGAYMSATGIGLFDDFSLDLTNDRLSVNSATEQGGLSVYSSYSTTGGGWPLVSFKADSSSYQGAILELTQDGSGDILQGYSGSALTFQVDQYGDMHLADTNGAVAFIYPFGGDPSSANLAHKNAGEGCIYSYGGDLYWDSACDSSAEEQLNGGGGLWSDGGTFTYLTATDDDLVLGASTTGSADFFFDVSEGRLGIGTDTPTAAIDIAGASSEISNTSGDITIDPADQLVILGDTELGDGSTTRSLYAYNAARTYYGQLELYNLATGNMTLSTTFDSGDIILSPGSSGGVGVGTATLGAGARLTSDGPIQVTSGTNTMVFLSNNVEGADDYLNGVYPTYSTGFSGITSDDHYYTGHFSTTGGGFRGMRTTGTYSLELGLFYDDYSESFYESGGSGIRVYDGNTRFFSYGGDAARIEYDGLRIGYEYPRGVSAVCSDSGGSLPAGTYYFTVVAKSGPYQTQAWYEDSCTVTSGSSGSATVSWDEIGNGDTSAEYAVYKGTSSGAEDKFQFATSSPYVWTTDAGASSGIPSEYNTTTAIKISNMTDIYFDTGYDFGIGITNPSAKLDVFGDARVSSTFNVGPNGDSGGIRYNTTDNQLEFSNDGSTWIPLGSATKTTTLSSEYAGAVLAADGSANTGSMTSDAEGSGSNSMNYYEWNSSETTLQDYDVRLRYTIPQDFSSWGTNAFTLNFATEAAASTNNKVDIYVYEESSGTVDDSSTAQYSSSAGVWQTTNIQGADLGDCNAAGETCLILIRMYSANDNYVRIGDIDVNYTRKL